MSEEVGCQEEIDGCRHLDASKGLRRMMKILCVWSRNSTCHDPSHNVPINFLINSHYFCTCFPYLLEELALSRGVVSVIPGL